VAIGVCSSLLVAWLGGALIASTVALGSLEALTDVGLYRGFWHHASILLPALAVTTLVRSRRHEPTRAVVVLWMIALESLVWNDPNANFIYMLGVR
jgi:hypothetical protein